MHVAGHHLQTPERPSTPITAPDSVVIATVDIEGTQLANPVVAVSRLLASEAEALARVDGDDRCLHIEVAVADLEPHTVDQARQWIHWAIHNAGVRGTTTVELPDGGIHDGPRELRSDGDEVAGDGVVAVLDEVGWPGQELGLSERESQVVALVTEGMTNTEIGDHLYLGSETVKTYVRGALTKLGCRNRVQAAAYVARSPAFARRRR